MIIMHPAWSAATEAQACEVVCHSSLLVNRAAEDSCPPFEGPASLFMSQSETVCVCVKQYFSRRQLLLQNFHSSAASLGGFKK